MRLLVALPLLLTAAPAAAQEDAGPITYEEALRCAFIGIGYGLRSEHDEATGRAIVGMGNHYLAYAEASSGKTTEAVVRDMGEASGPIVEQARQSGAPVAHLRQVYEACAQRAALLPPPPAD